MDYNKVLRDPSFVSAVGSLSVGEACRAYENLMRLAQHAKAEGRNHNSYILGELANVVSFVNIMTDRDAQKTD